MSKLGILAGLGWIIAVGAALAAFVVLSELIETRAQHRLETVRLPSRPATILPENWHAKPNRVLLVGDSRIRRWDPLPTDPRIAFATSAIGGETTGQLADRFDRDVLGVSPLPDEIILASGINDLVAASVQTRHAEVIGDSVSAAVVDRLRDMADRASARGIRVRIATIVQPTTPDLTRRLLFWDDSLYTLVSRTNRALAGLGYEMVDFNAVLEGGDGPMPERFSVDTLHFSRAAYDALNDALIVDYAGQ